MVDEAGQEQDRGLEDILHSGQRTKDNRTDDWRTSSTQVRGKGYKDRELEDILYSGQRTKDNRTEDWRTSSNQVRGQSTERLNSLRSKKTRYKKTKEIIRGHPPNKSDV